MANRIVNIADEVEMCLKLFLEDLSRSREGGKRGAGW
jgi:hypothetical protein